MLTAATDPVTDATIGAALEVHRRLGPGLLESAYAECLALEFAFRGIAFQREVALFLRYRDMATSAIAYRVDFVVEDCVVVELKALDRTAPVHRAQVRTYLRLGGYTRGLLINFGEPRLANGIARVVNDWPEPPRLDGPDAPLYFRT